MTSAVTIEHIQRVVVEHYGLDLSDMRSSYRARRLAWPRQVAMALSRELTAKSLPQIGLRFGGRDHTTVMHSIRQVSARCANHPDYETEVTYLRLKVAGNGIATARWQTICGVLVSLQTFFAGLSRSKMPPAKPDWQGLTALREALDSIGTAAVEMTRIANTSPAPTSPLSDGFTSRNYIPPQLATLRSASAPAREARE